MNPFRMTRMDATFQTPTAREGAQNTVKTGPGIAKAIRRAAGVREGEGVLRLAEATMGVRVVAPTANLDVVEAGIAYATGLWWMAASGFDVTRRDVDLVARELGRELAAQCTPRRRRPAR